MALGSENMAYHHKPAQYQLQHTLPREVLRTRVVNHQRSIAPAPYTKSSGTHNNLLAGTTLDSNNPAVVRRNARERSRVKQVNNGFSTLRQHIPTAIIAEISNGRRGIGPGADKKLSKVDTLRMAAEYIRRLKKVIDEVDNSDTSSLSSYGTLSPNSSYASSISSTPPPSLPLYSNIKNNNNKSDASTSTLNNNFNYQLLQAPQTSAEYFVPLSYAGSFQQSHLISPANSCESAESYQFHHSPSHYQLTHQPLITPNTTPIKMEPSPFNFDDCHHNITSSPSAASTADDEELLDYISLWQEQ